MQPTRCAAITAVLLLAALTACSTEAEPEPEKVANKPAAAPSAPSQADLDKARLTAGLPAEPKGTQRQAFIDGLNAIDTDIVHGKEDKAISRGIDTCGIFKRFPSDQTKQIDQTNKRWISAAHPDGHGLDKAAKILDVAHKNICPTF